MSTVLLHGNYPQRTPTSCKTVSLALDSTFNKKQQFTSWSAVFVLPESVDYKHDVVVDDLDVASHVCCDDLPLSPEFTALAEAIMTEEGLKVPENANDARNLYMTLINEINTII